MIVTETNCSPKPSTAQIHETELQTCVSVLEAIVADRSLLAGIDLEQRRRLLIAAGRLSRPERSAQRELAKAFRRRDHEQRKAGDCELLAGTGMRQARLAPVFQ